MPDDSPEAPQEPQDGYSSTEETDDTLEQSESEINAEIIAGFKSMYEARDPKQKAAEFVDDVTEVIISPAGRFDEYTGVIVRSKDIADKSASGMTRSVRIGEKILPDRFICEGVAWLGHMYYVLDKDPDGIIGYSTVRKLFDEDKFKNDEARKKYKELPPDTLNEIRRKSILSPNVSFGVDRFDTEYSLGPNDYAQLRHLLQQIESGELQPVEQPRY